VTPALKEELLGKSTAEKVSGVIESALGTAWREATEPVNESSPKR